MLSGQFCANSILDGRLKLTIKRFCMGLTDLGANDNILNHSELFESLGNDRP